MTNDEIPMKRRRRWSLAIGHFSFVIVLGLLLVACGDPQAEALKQLSTKGYSLSLAEFHRAARAGEVDCVRWFVQAGMEPDLMDAAGKTALEVAVSAGQAGVVEALLLSGAALPEAKGHALLVAGVKAGSKEVVELLLEHGLRPVPGEQPSPLVLAAGAKLVAVVEALLPFCPEVVQEGIFAAAASGDVAVLSKLVRAGGSLWAVDAQRRTPLIIAAANGQAAAVDLMLASGVDTLCLDAEQRCALEHAVQAGHEGIAGKLSVITLQDDEVTDPLEAASLRTRGNAAEVLELGRLIYVRPRLEPLPFLLERMEGRQSVLRLLLENRQVILAEGADIPGTAWRVGAVKTVPPFSGLVVQSVSGTGACWLLPQRAAGQGLLVAVVRDAADGHLYLAKVGDAFSITGTSTLELTVSEVSDLWIVVGEASGSGRTWTLDLGGRRM